MRRRDVLATIGVGLTTGLAGCGGQTDGPPTATDTDGPGGGVMTETETPTDGPVGGETDTESPTDEPLGGETDTETPTDRNVTSGTATDTGVTVADLDLQRAESFRMHIEVSDFQGMEGSATYDGRWHEGNFEVSITSQGATATIAHVDGTSYLVGGGNCTPMDFGESQYDTGPVDDSSTTAERLQEWADVTATGTETLDGEEVYVFEVEPDGRSISESFTYYISTATGYTRRVESDGLVAEYWDWGNVDPIQAPC